MKKLTEQVAELAIKGLAHNRWSQPQTPGTLAQKIAEPAFRRLASALVTDLALRKLTREQDTAWGSASDKVVYHTRVADPDPVGS
jgi:hypothetical protein